MSKTRRKAREYEENRIKRSNLPVDAWIADAEGDFVLGVDFDVVDTVRQGGGARKHRRGNDPTRDQANDR
jgi:hypothetical protein